ncbi:hypothetical protein C4J81_16015 [Deltaproteobacteria bacterium Smac51]|nr:hypothetical protein C4J81_16015 [Deltaproteobacteria bacterium Smac51]
MMNNDLIEDMLAEEPAEDEDDFSLVELIDSIDGMTDEQADISKEAAIEVIDEMIQTVQQIIGILTQLKEAEKMAEKVESAVEYLVNWKKFMECHGVSRASFAAQDITGNLTRLTKGQIGLESFSEVPTKNGEAYKALMMATEAKIARGVEAIIVAVKKMVAALVDHLRAFFSVGLPGQIKKLQNLRKELDVSQGDEAAALKAEGLFVKASDMKTVLDALNTQIGQMELMTVPAVAAEVQKANAAAEKNSKNQTLRAAGYTSRNLKDLTQSALDFLTKLQGKEKLVDEWVNHVNQKMSSENVDQQTAAEVKEKAKNLQTAIFKSVKIGTTPILNSGKAFLAAKTQPEGSPANVSANITDEPTPAAA